MFERHCTMAMISILKTQICPKSIKKYSPIRAKIMHPSFRFMGKKMDLAMVAWVALVWEGLDLAWEGLDLA